MSEADPEATGKRPASPSPYFLTLILVGFAIWFAYDGWWNPEIEHKLFNRIGAPIFALVAVWDGWRMRRRLHRAR